MFSMCSMQLIHFFVIFWLSDAIQTDSQYKLVETSNGKVLGQLEKSHFTNTPYVAFKGIPFAKPPIAELRFKVSAHDLFFRIPIECENPMSDNRHPNQLNRGNQK